MGIYFDIQNGDISIDGTQRITTLGSPILNEDSTINQLADVSVANTNDGQLLYWNGVSSQWTNTDGIYWIENNLGLGTNEPEAPLHIQRVGTAHRLLRLQYNDSALEMGITGDGIAYDFDAYNDGVSDVNIRFLRRTNTTGRKVIEFMRGDGTLSSSARIGVDGAETVFQVHGGYLGIGTSTPEGILHVVSSSSDHIGFLFDRSGSDTRLSISMNPDGSVVDFNPINSVSQSFNLRFFRNLNVQGTKRITVLRGDDSTDTSVQIGVDTTHSYFQVHGGNFGIGTDNPLSKLHIANVPDSNGSTSTSAAALTIGNSYQLRLFVDETNQRISMQAFHSGVSNNIPLLLNPGAGPVGIGTFEPQTELHLIGIERIESEDFSQLELHRTSTSGNGRWAMGIDPDGILCIRPRSTSWGHDGQNGINIDRNSNLGVGVGSPSAKLHVAGSALVSSNLTVNGSNITLGNLPTSNPGGSGRLWNNNGVLNIT